MKKMKKYTVVIRKFSGRKEKWGFLAQNEQIAKAIADAIRKGGK
ncbi:hypothetical protein [Geobacillus phage TP-84]|uniref:Uncharacterized protein n=1 Tax=Geobacillus phage TP-84 TaxID=1965361 RepID=A0A1U9WQM4_9CAUD|nr:hypothetical protein MUK65_gp44 [Geobacillus phage TP-84]AQY55062.1 hypothetical protein [Geobacillus phage TP-84]